MANWTSELRKSLFKRYRLERRRPLPRLRLAVRYHETLPLLRQPDPFDPQRMRIHWVIPDFPHPGSGGHTTIFRTIHHLESFGHDNVVWICGDTAHGSAAAAKRRLDEWYFQLRAPVRLLPDDLDEIKGDAVVATECWTAYPIRGIRNVRHRFYFVQDYEPQFRAMGAEYLLAEQTYRMGFTCITAGKWLEHKMREEFGADAFSFELAYDPQVYHEDSTIERTPGSVAFYARTVTERRAVDLGLLAFEVLAPRLPELRVQLYGNLKPFRPFQFPFHDHGMVTPTQLAELYRRATVGVVFSATNYSLVPAEMMACGLPVVDLDVESVRAVLPGDAVTLAEPTPTAIAAAVERLLLDETLRRDKVLGAQRFLARLSWENAGRQVEAAIRASIQQDSSAS